MRASGSPDIAIVGAGAAGIAAARTAMSLGLRATVLEAKDRVGGRAYSSTAEFGFPFDHGAHWLHSASLNPLVAFADEFGFDYARSMARRRMHLGNRWADGEEQADWFAYVERQWLAIDAAAGGGRDVAAASVVEPHERWHAPFLAWFAMMSSVEAEAVSARDHANYRDTGENWPLRQGLGALVARLADDLPIRLNCPVEAVDWGGPGVAIDTAAGRVQASSAIVTVSTSVLNACGIRFRPALPAEKQAAIAGLPLGSADKVAIAFDRNVFEAETPMVALSAANGRDILGFQIRPFGDNIAIGFAGGDFANALEAMSEADAAMLALDHLAAMFGNSLRRHVVATVRTRWSADPFIRGGYSAAAVGHAGSRAILAAPLADRLYFAGEATSPEFFSTVHGAYLSGVTAAHVAAAALNVAPPAPFTAS